MMLYFLHNGKCRVLSGTSLATLRQELKTFMSKHRNPDIKGFKPLESKEKEDKGCKRIPLSSISEPFQVVAIARTRKGYRLLSAVFSCRGKLMEAQIPPEAPQVQEKLEYWGSCFRSLLNNERDIVKKLSVAKLIEGL